MTVKAKTTVKVSRILPAIILALSGLMSLPSTVHANTFPGVNGRFIFTDVNGYDLYSVKTDGADRKSVSSATGAQVDAEYSPDGTKIVYIQSTASLNQVFTANADGSNPQQLTTSTEQTYEPSWSPDGTKILYTQLVSGVAHIYRMNADGSNKTQITNSSAFVNAEYSPDGTKILAIEDSSPDEVVVMNADGSNITNLTNNSVNEYTPNWSPNSSKIVYSSVVGGVYEVFTMNADGSGKTQLTSDGIGYHDAIYSPDGTKIAFVDNLAPSFIHIMNTDGSGIVDVPNSTWVREMSWQPLTKAPSSSSPNPTLSLSNGKATLNVASMYTDSYDGIDASSVTVTSGPSSGTTSVDSSTGVITYTPKATAMKSFWDGLKSALVPDAFAGGGTDSFTYRVCSLANGNLCSTGTVTVNLLGAPATGAGRPSAELFPLALAIILVATSWLGIRRYRVFRLVRVKANSNR